jgi:hypothetical protein
MIGIKLYDSSQVFILAYAKPERKIPFGGLKHTWDNIKMYLKYWVGGCGLDSAGSE